MPRKLTSQEQKDMELVKKIKPQLRKYLIQGQRKKAQQTAQDRTEENRQLLGSGEVIKQAGRLATVAIFQKKVWETIPPYLEWKWLKLGYTSSKLQREMNADILGFATYLVREYSNFRKLKATGQGYPNPMQEANLLFFWGKFNADLRLLIEAEMKRVAAGNASVILGKADALGKIEPFKKRIIH